MHTIGAKGALFAKWMRDEVGQFYPFLSMFGVLGAPHCNLTLDSYSGWVILRVGSCGQEYALRTALYPIP